MRLSWAWSELLPRSVNHKQDAVIRQAANDHSLADGIPLTARNIHIGQILQQIRQIGGLRGFDAVFVHEMPLIPLHLQRIAGGFGGGGGDAFQRAVTEAVLALFSLSGPTNSKERLQGTSAAMAAGSTTSINVSVYTVA